MADFRTRIFTCAALMLSLGACRPDDKEVQPIDVTVPTSMMPIQLPIIDNVYGAMYSIKLYHNIRGVETRSEQASAVFYEEASNTATATQLASAGYVAVNQFNLNQGANNEYDRLAVEGQIFQDLNFDAGVTWYVQGDDGVPPVLYEWSPVFPEYSGNFPATINRNEGLSLTFDESTLKNADSVYVAIAAGNKLIVKRYSAHAGVVMIPPADLMPMQACSAKSPGYLQISASVINYFWLSTGKQAVGVKQHTDIRSVVIN